MPETTRQGKTCECGETEEKEVFPGIWECVSCGTRAGTPEEKALFGFKGKLTVAGLREYLATMPDELPVVIHGVNCEYYEVIMLGASTAAYIEKENRFTTWYGKEKAGPDEQPVEVMALFL